ncbi:hypothetical protein [Deinococcus cellulosilyticus]|uniref:Uncharacterized protein n=1 Tax=Deinococcus cellulosilyticus (strain DSM 18568 / NBRC 106333 / KACC 11606 / 5516J-15) TaxID=1223518 RepID=A0A511MZ63_DEIC1|nr:hypothetical protein [Deinococcus cellulosilyticus]GEM45883.1 hypothetical protein DC3_15180 [Deinococcus cellulosilyticus NBRC 106333 = KACC 11606]
MTLKNAVTITIEGHSDDLLNIIGGGFYEEFNPDAEDPKRPYFLVFSDGTLLKVHYNHEGCWEIRPQVKGSFFLEHQPYTDPDKDYSDKVFLQAGPTWVVGGSDFTRAIERKN